MARKKEKSKAFWRWSIFAMMAGVFGLFAMVAMNMPPPTDTQTACRIDRQDPAHTVLLIDQSDPFSTNDFGWVNDFVDSEARRLPKHGRLTVITPNVDDPYDPRVLFSQCSTGAEANPIFENPRMVEDTWQATFREPLGITIQAVLDDKAAPSSPLAEALYAIFDRADFKPSDADRRVVIVSDLIQNSSQFNFYKKGADFDAFSATPLGLQIVNVDGAEVVARIVPRQRYDLPMADVKAFWDTYFAQSNANFTSVN